ncbi:DNA-binding domain-containing protein [Noviherbaspirillum sp.]|uniref:HvfC/BufC N-terminal domain-containing protein n=1 Tax=Noviherbaspirillum sp. TaxID=1926288 RepID=UPI002D4078B1|nr:DNA-binding domain-containing protein [Noviherbaspirillum sp.]HZW20837.1 DNA-binding domain-containing protein [Noviherbaspirillum sp.]
MTLAELQRDFRAWLVSASDESAARLGGGKRAGLAVYQNNYRAQLVGCLEQSFPQVRAWMGAEAFHYAAVSHIDRHPPHSWTLDAYADNFGATLAALFPRNPDIHELAWIEAALTTAFVARDAAPVAAADLANIDWDAARLLLAPSLLTLPATTNAAGIWSALHEGRDRPEAEMLAQPCALLVWRRGFVSRLHTVDMLEHEAILHVQANGSFHALCEMLVGRVGESEGVIRAGAMLAGWIGSELVTGVDRALPIFTTPNQGD